MNPQTRLFIGGPHDGKWYSIPGRDYYQPFLVPALNSPEEEFGPRGSLVRHERYNPMRFDSGEKITTLMVHESLSSAEAFERLLTNYRPVKEEAAP